MATDLRIDPSTRDHVATVTGDWIEDDDSRTAVFLQLECEYQAWPFDPSSGSRIKAMLRSGDPVQPLDLKAECERALGELVRAGVIADLVVTIGDYDSAPGNVEIELQYFDLASNSPVSLVYTPLGGVAR